MRHRKPSAIYGIVNRRMHVSRETLIMVALAVAAIWLVSSFAQEVFLGRDLERQAADLRQQNSALQAENRGYQRDIVASTSGAAAEEEARGDGYSKPKEKLYLIGDSPSPTPNRTAPAPVPASHKTVARPPSHAGKQGNVQRFVGWLLRLALP